MTVPTSHRSETDQKLVPTSLPGENSASPQGDITGKAEELTGDFQPLNFQQPKATRFVTSDLLGNIYEVNWKPEIRGTQECSLAIRLLSGDVESDWNVFKIAIHYGARHAALLDVFASSLEDLGHPSRFADAVDYLVGLSEGPLVSCSSFFLPEGAPAPTHEEKREAAIKLLVDHKIPIETWGKASAKRLEDLLTEIETGESRLLVENGQLIRYVEVARANVLFRDDSGQLLQLREESQTFSDGRVRHRSVTHAVGGKIAYHETAVECVRREIGEELGLDAACLPQIPVGAGRMAAFEGECMDYPGLTSRKIHTSFDVQLPPQHFRPDGYTEIQPDKCTEFRWSSADTTPSEP